MKTFLSAFVVFLFAVSLSFGGGSNPTYVVKDGTGVVIGPADVTDLPFNVKTIVEIRGHQVPVTVTASDLFPTLTTFGTWYESTDCSGQIWVGVDTGFAGFSTAVGERVSNSPTKTFRLLEKTSDIPVVITAQSRFVNTNCSPFSFNPTVIPAQEIVSDLQTLFPRPYSVEEQQGQ